MAVDKLVDSTQLDADLTSIANAIRTKGGTSAQLAFPADFVSAINNMPAPGGGYFKVLQGTKTPSTNSTYLYPPYEDINYVVYAAAFIDRSNWSTYEHDSTYDSKNCGFVWSKHKAFYPTNASDQGILFFFLSGNSNGHSYKTSSPTLDTDNTRIKAGYSGYQWMAGVTYNYVVVGVVTS